MTLLVLVKRANKALALTAPPARRLIGKALGLTTNHPNSMLSASNAPGIGEILHTRKSRT